MKEEIFACQGWRTVRIRCERMNEWSDVIACVCLHVCVCYFIQNSGTVFVCKGLVNVVYRREKERECVCERELVLVYSSTSILSS